jgi:NAD(P)-dependent dehydrogenase (short-subunit alcohol dehydrogenase family)
LSRCTRLGEPREITDAIAWLGSERASFVVVRAPIVDGGVRVSPHALRRRLPRASARS